MARKRFLLGYPPRKDSDISIGDAVNWEWIIHCAKRCGSDVIIVTRDGNFGKAFEGRPIINDWLRQEFKERVSKKRNVEVTNRLSEAMKKANIKVTLSEENQEEKLIRERPKHSPLLDPEQPRGSMNPASDAALQRIFGPLATTLSENLRRTAFEQFSEPKKSFENLSREEELVLGHLYYEQKQTIDDLAKNSGLSKAVIRNVVESLPHFIKKDKNDIFSAPVINKTKARELVEPASEKRKKQI